MVEINSQAPEYYGYYNEYTNCINIFDGTPVAGQIATLAHELQHVRCKESDCFCWLFSPGSYYREYHAYRAELIECFNNIPALRWAIWENIRPQAKCGMSDGHTEACQRLMTTKLWKKAMTLLELS